MENKVKMKAMLKQMQSVIALVIIFVVASVVCVKDGKNNFLDLRNLMNVLRAVSENGIIAIGMTMIIITGNIDLSVGVLLSVILTAVLASVGTAGVPGVGMITLAMVLQSANLPLAGIALIIGFDRILDMMRTTVNVMGDCVCSVIVAKSEDELDEKKYSDYVA